MNKTIFIGAAMLPIALSLAACSGEPPKDGTTAPKHPAYLYIVNDVSSSARVQADDAFGKAVRARAAQAVKQLKPGDRVQLVNAGSLQADRLVAYPLIKTGYGLSLAKAGQQLAQQMDEVATSARASGGDDATNIIATLSNLRPDCASGRSEIKITSDGLEQSHAYSAVAAINAGKPIVLPPPSSGTSLKGCKIEFIGFAMVVDSAGTAALLPEVHLIALRKGWEIWLIRAGVAPSDMTFTSLL